MKFSLSKASFVHRTHWTEVIWLLLIIIQTFILDAYAAALNEPAQEYKPSFSAPTYIVLDLPSPVGNEVVALRARYDAFTANLPVEITIAGSSGVGTLMEGQESIEIFAAIEKVGCAHLPFSTSLVSLERFPGTQVFWLRPRDRRPFDAIQAALVAEGIKFQPSPFSFTPHLTISAQAKLSPVQQAELLSTPFPKQEFTLSTLSVFQLVDGKASLLRTFEYKLNNQLEAAESICKR